MAAVALTLAAGGVFPSVIFGINGVLPVTAYSMVMAIFSMAYSRPEIMAVKMTFVNVMKADVFRWQKCMTT